jgi:signal peptidase I
MEMAKSRADSRPLWRAVKEFAVVIAIVVVSRSVVAQPFYVPSGSMEPTLQIGDELLATKYPYGYSRYSLPFGFGPSGEHRLFERLPTRGDVVVFHLPRDPAEVYVKRVVGLPGDHLQLRGGRLFINDAQLPLRADGSGAMESEDGSTITAGRFIETLPDGREHPIFKLNWTGAFNNTAVFTVPAGHLFMMGDNRDDSLDSRVPAEAGGVGFVPLENLVGRADVVVGSWDFPITRQPFWTWPSGVRWSRFLSGVS